MIPTDVMTEIRAFAEVYGFDVLQKKTRNEELFTISKRIGNIDAPRCPYMSPYELGVWIDGYRMGLNDAAPIREEEQLPQSQAQECSQL